MSHTPKAPDKRPYFEQAGFPQTTLQQAPKHAGQPPGIDASIL
jgi:hypothetical protein